MEKYLLGLDVGTTGTKAILFSTDGSLVGQAYRSYPTDTPQVLFSEQNAEDWWKAVCETVREVCNDDDRRAHVAAIALSTQGGTVVPVDEKGIPLRPATVWNDGRCRQEYEEFTAQTAASKVYRKTGWPLTPAAPMLQMQWIRKHQPEVYEKTAMYLSVADFLSYRMTGIAAVDISNVGINRFADIQNAAYEDRLLAFCGLREEQLAAILPSGQQIGHLTSEAAEALGLSTETVLVSGAHDQYAVALGAGACQAGDILIGSGTCWVVTSMGDEPAFETGLPQSVAAVPGKWGSVWSLSSGGICLEWWRKNLASAEDGQILSFEQINHEVAKRKAAEDGLFFYPFSGCADRETTFPRASFVGLDLSYDKYHMARAIMEGVAFQIVWMLEAFSTKPSQDGLILSGGASKSEIWCRMVADIANLPVQVPETADLACVGAAVLAGVGSGVFADVQEGCRRLAVSRKIIYPDRERAEIYGRLLKDYRKKAALLKALYEE